MSQQQLSKLLISELPWYFEKLVLSIGLLIAIIVTANLIPETFEPGSLNLLLSKPISRWGLYVAKFVGGCAFIAICAAYLF
ncbi:ABC transporter permease, partial [bacterium]|nr:ABC transporter permease [bacterium]